MFHSLLDRPCRAEAAMMLIIPAPGMNGPFDAAISGHCGFVRHAYAVVMLTVFPKAGPCETLNL